MQHPIIDTGPDGLGILKNRSKNKIESKARRRFQVTSYPDIQNQTYFFDTRKQAEAFLLTQERLGHAWAFSRIKEHEQY